MGRTRYARVTGDNNVIVDRLVCRVELYLDILRRSTPYVVHAQFSLRPLSKGGPGDVSACIRPLRSA